MNQLQQIIPNYLDYCHYQKKLNSKTLKAYRIDLTQFLSYMQSTDFELNRSNLSKFIINLHKQYKPKSVKRKMASVKALFTYLEYPLTICSSYLLPHIKISTQLLILIIKKTQQFGMLLY